MTKPTDLNRRQLMLGAGAVTTIAATTLAAASGASAQAAPDAKPLAGTSILITGASSGFGRLGAEHYARLGAKVFATMRNLPRPEATELETLTSDENLDITVIEIDVTSDAQVTAGVAAVLAANDGKLDVLINNAGIAYAGPIEAQDMAATQLIFDTNVYGPHRMSRAVLPAMRAAGKGLIFNVTSQLGRLVIPGFGQYSPTKFALEAMSEQMAYEVAMQGIEVSIIQPGGYPTDIWENQTALSKALKERLPEDLIEAYGPMTAGMGGGTNNGGRTDPMDIPGNIAAIIQMPAGTRPLRRAVHPNAKPQVPINEVSAQQQMVMLGETGYGPLLKAVLD